MSCFIPMILIIFFFQKIEFQALFAEIEGNQAKLDQCQKLSQQYSAAVKVTQCPHKGWNSNIWLLANIPRNTWETQIKDHVWLEYVVVEFTEGDPICGFVCKEVAMEPKMKQLRELCGPLKVIYSVSAGGLGANESDQHPFKNHWFWGCALICNIVG